MSSDGPGATTTCANCGATLTSKYCPDCGQSRQALLRPALNLAGQVLSDAFDLDGRLWRTVRRLYLKPGAVARDYVEGRRQSFTPPIRMYVLASLFFLGLVALAGVRVVAVQISGDPDPAVEESYSGVNVAVTLFGLGEPPAPLELPPNQLEMGRQAAGGEGSLGDKIFMSAISDPAGLERTAATAVNLALIVMVALYAVWNTLLHPRRRLIEHVVHATYFHAGLYPVVAASLAARRLLGESASPVLPLILAAVTALWFLFWVIASDRGFYKTSLVGLILRAPLLLFGYLVVVSATSMGLIGFAVWRGMT